MIAKFKPSTKVAAAILAVAVSIVLTLILINRGDSSPNTATTTPGADSAPAVLRPDSHRLSTAPDGKVTVVEFLDFECEACGAAFEGVEQLRAEYRDRVTFAVRYFPIPSHRNAETAASAVEAAGRQGKWEPMYRKMFQTQPQWGDQQVSHADTFRGFARELGLDMTRFEADWADPATTARVLADRSEGADLGVRATPTFFINNTKFTGRPTYAALKAALDAELAK